MPIERAVLIPFETKRLADAIVALRNPAFDLGTDDQILDRFAYAIPTADEQPRGYLDNAKTLSAERYGGEGMVRHGGGVRCGVDGDYLVKGIGRNLLAGADVPLDESSGTMRLSSAIAEAVLGELCHRALPWGGVRIAAVVATGAYSVMQGNRVRNGLAIRPAVVRPGHFMRSIYYRPLAETVGRITSDAVRVREAIQFLPDVVPRSRTHSSEEWSRLDGVERLHAGLSELAVRLAEQTAAAESRRIVHGAISASNVDMSGAWLDYETLSALPGYGSVNRMPSHFWDAPLDCRKILEDICFYIAKYFPAPSVALPQAKTLLDTFASAYGEAAHQRFLLLTGFPMSLVSPHFHSHEARSLSSNIIDLAQAGRNVVYARFPDERDEFGEFAVGKVLTTAAAYYHLGCCADRLAPLIPGRHRLENFLEAYRAFAKLVYADAARIGIRPIALRRLSTLNAAKAAKSIPIFLRKRLVHETVAMDDESIGVPELRDRARALFTDAIDKASFVYVDAVAMRTCMWRRKDTHVDFDAIKDIWHVCGGTADVVFPWKAIWQELPVESPLAATRAYWGEEVWSMLA